MSNEDKSKKYTELKFTIGRMIQPKNWSLRTRLVYTTGAILICGALLTLAAISFSLNKSARSSIHNKLDDFEHLLKQQVSQTLNSNAIIAAQLASSDRVITALYEKDRPELQDIIAGLNNNIRSATGSSHIQVQFYTETSEPILNQWSGEPAITVDENLQSMVKEAEDNHYSLAGVRVQPEQLILSSISPVFKAEKYIGCIEIGYSYETLFKTLNLESKYGISIIINNAYKSLLTNPEQYPSIDGQPAILNIGTTNLNQTQQLEKNNEAYCSVDFVHLKKTILDNNNHPLGNIFLYYDAAHIIEESRSTIMAISWMAFFGVLFLSFSLYWNVNRIRDFFKQMKKVLISSHSNDFNELFSIDNIHCLDVLQCGHKECPMYQDPTRVCYLETGDEAISPKYRNSCIFLNKYKKCKHCPVYKMRHGDEIMEMKHVVNTMMRLWSDFLGSVGTLLSEVFRAESGHMPSLDDVSGYLSQMAGLTNYSHDLQGVYGKDEVYRQLEYIFEKQFGLTAFNLLEVNPSENRMESVITKYDISTSHMEVTFNCELCRCMRVAEDVDSYTNPHLCPYFGIEEQKQVRCCLPMVMGGRVGAVFTFVVDKPEWTQKKKVIAIMKKYLDETAPILSSLRLLKISKEQALKDPLTLCHNRRFMDEYLAQFERINHRDPKKIGFIMADLDHFKMVNDEFGHLAGDEVLKQLANILRQEIRNSDLLIRYGGEEFLIILLEINQDGVAYSIAEKIRVAVEAAKLALPSGGVIKKTLSMGVSEFPKDGEQLYQVIKYADVALYKAKETGRNKVLRFEKDMWETEDY